MKKKPSQGRGKARAGKSDRERPARGGSRPDRSSTAGMRKTGSSSWDDYDRSTSPRSKDSGAGEKRPYQRRDDDRTEKRPYQRREEGSGEKRPYQRRDDDRSEKRPYQRREEGSTERRPYQRREEGSGEKRSYQRRDDDRTEKRPYQRREEGSTEKRPYQRRDDDRTEKRPYQRREEGSGEKRPYQRRDEDRSEKRPYQRREEGSEERRPYQRRDDDRTEKRPYQRREEGSEEKRPYQRRDDDRTEKRPYQRREEGERSRTSSRRGGPPSREERHAWFEDKYAKGRKGSGGTRKRNASDGPDLTGEIRLNRFLAMSGIGSRREADELITAGLVTVNGKLITELGTKVNPGDEVRYNNERIRNEKHVYLLLNKPKDYISTAEDPEERKTVMELIEGACKERVYPVGRLDRNTTGLLLFTNDGDLARYLTHPSSKVKKLYHVELDKNLKVADMRQLTEGVELEDGISRVDDISFDGEGADKKSVGVELHSGKNRVVRRLFEALGYDVRKLDRVGFAGLTKKDLPRGRWRFLDEKEVGYLKMMGTGKKKKAKEVEAE